MTDSQSHSGADDYLANIVEGRCADAESILRMVVMARAEVRRLEEQLTTMTRERDEMAQLHEDHSRALRMEKDWEKARIVQLEEQLEAAERTIHSALDCLEDEAKPWDQAFKILNSYRTPDHFEGSLGAAIAGGYVPPGAKS